jgi:hypothetical protein
MQLSRVPQNDPGHGRHNAAALFKSSLRLCPFSARVFGTLAALPISSVALSNEECDAQEEKMDRRRAREIEVYG